MEAWQERLQQILEGKRNTPYEEMNCIMFAVTCYDELYGITDPIPESFTAPDLLTNGVKAYAAFRDMIERYPCEVGSPLLDDVQPGDAIVFSKPPLLSVGHVGIVGNRRGEIWHSSKRPGVCATSWGATQKTISHVYRMLNKESW